MSETQSRRKGHYWAAVVLLYIYIFNPVFRWPGIGLVNVLLFFSIPYIILHFNRCKLYFREYKLEFFLTVIMIIYVYYRTRLPGSNAQDIVSTMIIWLLSTVFVSIFIVDSFFRKQSNLSFSETVLDVSFIAAVISVLCLLIPPFNAFIRGIQSQVEFDVWSDTGFTDIRCFGLALNLTSTYGYVLGVLASFCLLRLFTGNKSSKYLLYFVFLTVATAVNAKTGLLPIFITLFYITINILRNGNVRSFLYFLVGVILLIPVIHIVLNSDSEILSPIRRFLISTVGFLLKGSASVGSETYYFDVLENSIFFPDRDTLLFGQGITFYGKFEEFGMRSDIMYVNQLFIGGLVFLFLLLIYVFLFYRKLWRLESKVFFPILLLIMALIANFKGSPFYASNAFTRLVTLYYFVSVYNKRNPQKFIETFQK